MKNKVIFIECILIIPCVVAIFNYKLAIDSFNILFSFLGLDTRGTHLTLGEWFLMIYLVGLPIVQLLMFSALNIVFGIQIWERNKVWFVTLCCSLPAAYMYLNGTQLIT